MPGQDAGGFGSRHSEHISSCFPLIKGYEKVKLCLVAKTSFTTVGTTFLARKTLMEKALGSLTNHLLCASPLESFKQ